jgi:hypothetical protein
VLTRREHNTSKEKEGLDVRAIPRRKETYCIGWRSKAWQEHGMYNCVHPYRLADIKGASAARRVATTNGGKGSEK